MKQQHIHRDSRHVGAGAGAMWPSVVYHMVSPSHVLAHMHADVMQQPSFPPSACPHCHAPPPHHLPAGGSIPLQIPQPPPSDVSDCAV